MKKLIYIIIIFVACVTPYSCTKDFDEINSNPNDPSLAQADPGMLLTNAIESLTDRVHNIFLGHEMGSCWAQHMAKVQYTDEDRYIPRVSVINAAWSSLYAASGNDIATVISVSESTLNDNMKAVGMVLQAYIVSLTSDLFGDVPYTEAWMGTATEPIISPAYDKQSAIYPALIAALGEANTLLSEDGAEIAGDILFDGDVVAWKKFANSLKLRLLLRMSAKDEAFVTTEMSKIVGDDATYPIFTSSADQAALAYLGSAPNNHPINENRKTRDDHRVSQTLIDVLYNSGAPEIDYRLMAYANPSEGTGDYVGLPNGMKSADAGAFNGNGLKNTSTIGDFFTQPTTPGMLMSYPELKFILAEAAFKGYIPGGNAEAEAQYNAGITASYLFYAKEIGEGIGNFYGVPDDAYVPGTGDPNTDPLVWFLADGGWVFNSSKAMEQIATQRWVATFDQGLQSWIEWRRTGYPVLTPAVDGVNDGKIPVRVYYPSDEAARNPSSLQEAVSGLGGPDDLNTKVWWDVD